MARITRTAAVLTLVRALRGASGPDEPGLAARLRAVPRLVRATASGDYSGTSRGRLAALVAAAVYVVSPVDLLPDWLPLIGLADDAVVISWLAAAVLGETGGFLRWERAHAGRRPAGPREDVVPGYVVR